MQSPHTRFATFALAGLLALTPACASSGGRTSDAADDFAVLVNNNTVPPASVTVYLQPEVGSRRMLGSVQPNSQRTFDDFEAVGGRYRLVADALGSGTIVSDPFLVADADVVRWNLSLNSIVMGDGDQ